MMRARVKPDARLHVVTACAGINFTKREWFRVPEGREEEALNNPYLEVELGENKEVEPVDDHPIHRLEPEAEPPQDEPPPVPEFVESVAYAVDATEAARTLAAASGIDLWSIEGTGQDGKVTVTDVRNAIKEADNDD